MLTKTQIQTLIAERIQEIKKELLKQDKAKTYEDRVYFNLLLSTLLINEQLLEAIS
jgi:hypothetical protein